MNNCEIRVGDIHNNEYVRVTYHENKKYVYKPRSLCIDAVWVRFCLYLKRVGFPYTIVAPIVYGKSTEGLPDDNVHPKDYGYTEFIEYEPLDYVDEANAYYETAGCILLLCYMLGTRDIHSDNLIANRCNPVLVDLETLLSGEVGSFTKRVSKEESHIYRRSIKDSVLYSSLLPHYVTYHGISVDMGGLSGQYGNDLVPCQNMPFLYYGSNDNDKLAEIMRPEKYINNIVSGFISSHEWICSHRNEIIAKSPYTEFATCPIRVIIRPTQVYVNLINRLSQPDMQNDPEKYEAQLSKLVLAFTKYAHPSVLPKLIPIYEAEAAAIRRGNIPYFTTRADSTAICDENGNVLYEDYFRMSAFERSKRILMNMNERDCEFQVELIRASFHASYPPEEQPEPLPQLFAYLISEQAAFLRPNYQSDIIGSLTAEAEAIYYEIASRGCEIDDGAPAWPMQCAATEGACGVKITEIGMYSGRAGVALFDAALYAVTGSQAARNDAERLVEAIFAELEDRDSTHLLEKLSLGLANGVGGVLISISEISRYINKPEYIPRAVVWLDKLTDAWLAHDKDYDVIGGASGLMLAMYSIGAKPETITRVADRILDNRKEYNGHKLIYRPHMDNLPLTGMGHGAAGIACGLLAAWRATNDEKYRDAALDMLAYEQECFSPEESNWPDFRKNPDVPPDKTVYMHGWCAGAPGIGFSRKLIQKLDLAIDVSADIYAAQTWAQNHAGVWRDHLCCGNATLVDWLTECGDIETAREIAARMLARKQRDGKYCLSTFQGQFVCDVGLFSGLSGIGYAFLRAAYPDKVKSVLM